VAAGAWRVAAPAQIPVIRRRNRSGKGRRVARGSPTVDLWPRMGGGEPAAGRPAAHREHGRGGLCSGELPAWDEPRAVRWVRVGLGEGLGRQCGVGHGREDHSA
jgi:hypothetical protein